GGGGLLVRRLPRRVRRHRLPGARRRPHRARRHRPPAGPRRPPQLRPGHGVEHDPDAAVRRHAAGTGTPAARPPPDRPGRGVMLEPDGVMLELDNVTVRYAGARGAGDLTAL